MNEKKIAFIMCVNDEQYFEECVFYIQHLLIPEGYEIDTIAVRGASSMTQGYNEAMRSTDAKYKVYIHQDVLLLNRHFLYDILQIFQENPEYGMLGVVGGREVDVSGEFSENWDTFHVFAADCHRVFCMEKGQKENKENQEVLAVDGMLMITQYDVDWREDLFDGWHFYDVSQSMEFRKKGYKIMVPYMDHAWAFHDAGYCSNYQYDKYRKRFCEEYANYGFCYVNHEDHYFDEKIEIAKSFKEEIEEAFKRQEYEKVEQLLQKAHAEYDKDTWIETVGIIMELHELEVKSLKEPCFLKDVHSTAEAIYKYNKVKFYLKRMEFGFCEWEYEELIRMITNCEVRMEAVLKIMDYSCFYPKRVWDKITKIQYREPIKILQECSFDQYGRYETIRRLAEQMKHFAGRNKLKVLEVGANEHQLLGKIMLDDDVYYTDLEVPSEFAYDYHYFVSDATDMKNIQDNSYDLIVAADVFEHISHDLRKQFISECYRVAKLGVIFCFPFASAHNQKAEWESNEFFMKLTGEEYRWLREHIENGLPQKEAVEDYLQREHIPYISLEHGDIELWEQMMKIHFYAYVHTEQVSNRDKIDFLYNKYVYSQDVSKENYRVFYVLLKENLKDDKDKMGISFEHGQDNETRSMIREFSNIISDAVEK